MSDDAQQETSGGEQELSAGDVPDGGVPKVRRTIAVPMWVALVVAALAVGAGGFALGRLTADDDESRHEVRHDGDRYGRHGQFPEPFGDRGMPGPDGMSEIPRALLGVLLDTSTDPKGAEVVQVLPGSPADDGGLEQGDVITKIGDDAIATAEDGRNAVSDHEPGDEVTIKYTRDGKSKRVDVKLGDRFDATPPTTSRAD